MFSGIFNEPDLCQAAPSQTNMILSLGNVLDNSFKNKFIQSVLQYGMVDFCAFEKKLKKSAGAYPSLKNSARKLRFFFADPPAALGISICLQKKL